MRTLSLLLLFSHLVVSQSEDPEEDARLKQLQAAAAHWQQHQQHRVGFQYQGIMQKHTQLQQILQQYQQVIQHPPHIQVRASLTDMWKVVPDA